MLKYTGAILALLFTTAVSAAEITPYGTINYKWSHDENTSGVAENINRNQWLTDTRMFVHKKAVDVVRC